MTRHNGVYVPERKVDVVEDDRSHRKGRLVLDLARDLHFSTDALESYAFARWEPVVGDAMVVAAAIEYGDRAVKRPAHGWARRISLSIPVYEPSRWTDKAVSGALHEVVEFLTGDYWEISFVKRKSAPIEPRQEHLAFQVKTSAVLAFSDGMDSCAVAGIVASKLGDGLIRVHVGSKSRVPRRAPGQRIPFAAIPYTVAINVPSRESSARNRGLKFAMISAIAAYLTETSEIVVPESGQGAIGPALITVGHAYPDYRNHPLFTTRMERFVGALFGQRIRYVHPRLWHTKGETLGAYVAIAGNDHWGQTKSCWRSNQWSSLDGKWRQCGVCAACMLRRLSVHAAGLTESPDTYICNDLSAPTLVEAVATGFTKFGRSFEEYAIAGVLHLEHLADMARTDAHSIVQCHAVSIARCQGESSLDTNIKLSAMLDRHALEWKNYLNALGARSFLKKWTRTEQ